MMMYDTPTAVLIGADGYQRVVAVPLPPPREYQIAIPVRTSVVESPAAGRFLQPHRVFRLSQFRSRDVQWWHVYNDGRSRTPEDGYVYFELAAALAEPPHRREEDGK